MTVFPCTDPQNWGPAIDEAVNAVSRGALIVLPTDTVYGIGTDAFSAAGVNALLEAKGRTRQSPPPVLVADQRTLTALTVEVPEAVSALTAAFWPGALTIVCRAQPALTWDLGETHGTVAVRMPDNPAALALLKRTGPLAVSSANLTGATPAQTAFQAQEQLKESVAVYLDGGAVTGGVPSTIIDATTSKIRILREGAISLEQLQEVVPEVLPRLETAPAHDDSNGGENSDSSSEQSAGENEKKVRSGHESSAAKKEPPA